VAVDPTTTIAKDNPRVVTFTVKNTGQTTANKLTASVDLPADVFLDALEVPGDWTCGSFNGSNHTATCTLPSLAPGVTSALRVAIHANGNTSDEIITASVSADGLVAVPASTTLQMVESPLAYSGAVTADLVLGAPGPIAFAVTNTGTAPATGVTATVTVLRAVTLVPAVAVSVGGATGRA